MKDKKITFTKVKDIWGVEASQAYNIIKKFNVRKYGNSLGRIRFLESEIMKVAEDREKFTVKITKGELNV